jgi:hypothetical protein
MMLTSAAAGLFLLLSAVPVSAQAGEVYLPIRTAAACAPVPAAIVPGDAPRVAGVQDTVPRKLFGPRDLLILDGGAGQGLQLDQRFFIRRLPTASIRHGEGRDVRGASTVGWVRIVAVTSATAIGLVEYACDGIVPGDVLMPYAEPQLPPGVADTDARGELDFAAAGRVLFGDNERVTGADGDFLVTDLGADDGMRPGVRLAIYRDVGVEGVPLSAVGEAIVVSVEDATSLIRLTRLRDVVAAGDLLVPRRQP